MQYILKATMNADQDYVISQQQHKKSKRNALKYSNAVMFTLLWYLKKPWLCGEYIQYNGRSLKTCFIYTLTWSNSTLKRFYNWKYSVHFYFYPIFVFIYFFKCPEWMWVSHTESCSKIRLFHLSVTCDYSTWSTPQA